MGSDIQEANSIGIKPPYYKRGKTEVWDFIMEQNLGFLEGNIIKYVCRYKGKNGLEDLIKAKTYLEKLIDTYNNDSTRV